MQPTAHTTVLFACKQNAGRSQMAAAIAASVAPAHVTVLSAGTTPANEIHPEVRVALEEIGLKPLSSPQLLTQETVAACDWVVTMGCGETCPVIPGKHYLDWDIQDPSGKSLKEVREIRAEITRRVRQLLERLENPL